nr:MAG TPA: hypothetical protein [Caudoviricetes sp.]
MFCVQFYLTLRLGFKDSLFMPRNRRLMPTQRRLFFFRR